MYSIYIFIVLNLRIKAFIQITPQQVLCDLQCLEALYFSILQNSLCMICKEIKGRRKWGEGEEKKTNLTFNESSTTWLLTFGIPVCYIVHTSVWYVYFHCQ